MAADNALIKFPFIRGEICRLPRSMPSNAFSPNDLARIERETFIHRVEFFPELASTNDYALRQNDPASLRAPRLILAERQTSGRGRGSNRWWSAEGALTFSLVLAAEEAMPPGKRSSALSLVAGLAVCETLAELLPARELAVKWPNDVFLQRRKVCGILVESPGGARPVVVVGIGLNVNNSPSQAPPPICDTANSLRDAAGYEFEIIDVLIRLLRQIEAHIRHWRTAPDSLPELWGRWCMLTDGMASVQAGANAITGICRGIDAEGALLLQNETGLERCLSGVVLGQNGS